MQYFILGVVFCISLQPILDSLTSLVISFIEMLKGYIALNITRNNQKMQQEEKHNTIGFSLVEEVEDCDI